MNKTEIELIVEMEYYEDEDKSGNELGGGSGGGYTKGYGYMYHYNYGPISYKNGIGSSVIKSSRDGEAYNNGCMRG